MNPTTWLFSPQLSVQVQSRGRLSLADARRCSAPGPDVSASGAVLYHPGPSPSLRSLQGRVPVPRVYAADAALWQDHDRNLLSSVQSLSPQSNLLFHQHP